MNQILREVEAAKRGGDRFRNSPNNYGLNNLMMT